MTSDGFKRSYFTYSMLAVVALAIGACGSDGAPSDGGAGSGGRAGSGGAGPGDGGGGSRSCPTPQYTSTTAFGAIFDGWVVGNNSTYTLVPMPGVDGGPPTGTIVELDATDGSPTNGSAKLSIPFMNVQEELLFAKLYTPGVNLAGTKVTAQIKLDSGLITGPTDQGSAFIALKSGAEYTWAPGNSITLDPSAGWVPLTLSADAPNPDVPLAYNPCDVREIDIIIRTGYTGMYKAAVMHIDTIAITPN